MSEAVVRKEINDFGLKSCQGGKKDRESLTDER